MLIRNTKDVSVSDVQGYLSKGVRVHPRLYMAFLDQLAELERKHHLCLLPITRLELYTTRVRINIARRLAA